VPEGDTIHAAAARLGQALTGAVVERVSGTHPDAARHGARVAGHAVTGVSAVGKHLLIAFDNGWVVRTHLGMPGSWHLYRPGERWQRSPGAARVALTTADWVAVCFAAPTVQIAPAEQVQERIAHLGPDPLGEDFDPDEVVLRAAAADPDRTVADLLLDQSVIAGVGNVLKSEILFLEGLHPATPAGALDRGKLLRLAERARRLLQANRRPGPRVTTGTPARGYYLWVAGRSGQPCRRCTTPIEQGWVGDPPRVTTWCPLCQPED